MKTTLATFLGVIAGMFTIFAVHWCSHYLFPLPQELNPNDPESIRANFDLIPLGALLMVALAHGLGIVVGSLTARKFDNLSLVPVYMVASFFMIATLLNLMAIPHPTWFWLLDLTIVVFPALIFISKWRKNS